MKQPLLGQTKASEMVLKYKCQYSGAWRQVGTYFNECGVKREVDRSKPIPWNGLPHHQIRVSHGLTLTFNTIRLPDGQTWDTTDREWLSEADWNERKMKRGRYV